MSNMLENHFEKIKEYIILGIVLLFPLIVSNLFIDQVQLPKLIFLGFGIWLTLTVIAIEIFVNKKFIFGKSKFDFPILLLIFSYLISGIITTPNKIEAFFSPGNALFIIGLGILYFLINTIENKDKVKTIIIVDGVILSIATLMNFLDLFSKLSFLPSFTKTTSFNLTGDFLTSTIFIIVALPFGINFLIKEKKVTKKILYAFSLALILVGIGISLFGLFSSDKNLFPVLPPLSTSWAVAIETIKESPVTGIGPGNYLTAFDRFRPINYNQSQYWQLRFSSSRNVYLTILTETGILGGISIIFLIMTILKTVDRSRLIYKESRSITIDMISVSILAALLIFIAFFPASPTGFMLLFVILAINSKPTKQFFSLESTSNFPKIITALIILSGIIFFAIKAEPVILAEFKFKDAYIALNANDGKRTYDLLRESINLNPEVDRYHASFAQVNLAIARSIIASKKDPKDLTDNEKNSITTLIKQAVQEGQATVALNQTRSANWEVLSNVYQTIIPFVKDTDVFAIQSYNQAINLDPINPNLRINLGQIYYSQGKYDDAINTFQLAIFAKPDLANTHYNLAIAYRDNKQIDKAIAEIQAVLTLVKNPSADYTLAKNELDNLEKKKAVAPTSNNQTGSTLTTPEKTQPAINPQITLPTDASPPAAPKLPT